MGRYTEVINQLKQSRKDIIQALVAKLPDEGGVLQELKFSGIADEIRKIEVEAFGTITVFIGSTYLVNDAQVTVTNGDNYSESKTAADKVDTGGGVYYLLFDVPSAGTYYITSSSLIYGKQNQSVTITSKGQVVDLNPWFLPI